MRNLHPEQTKVRIYLDADKQRGDDRKAMFLRRVREFTVDAVCEVPSPGGQSIVEVIARRDTIHQHVVPLIEEMLPNAFVTMEAVCAFRTREISDHPVYGSKISDADNVKRLHH